MRRFLLILTPALLLGLAACGGTQGGTQGGTPASGAPAGNVEVLAAASGGSGPANTEEPPALEVPANAVGSFTVEGATHTATAKGGMTVSGTIVNNGTKAAKPTQVIVLLLDEAGQTVSRASFSDTRFTMVEPGAGLTWQAETLFTVSGNQRLSFAVEGIDEAAGQ